MEGGRLLEICIKNVLATWKFQEFNVELIGITYVQNVQESNNFSGGPDVSDIEVLYPWKTQYPLLSIEDPLRNFVHRISFKVIYW